MFRVNPLLCTDGYKTSHHLMYPKGTSLVFSNFTPRSTKYMPKQAQDIVVFGVQYTMRYINDLFNENFFFTELRKSALGDSEKEMNKLKSKICDQLQKHLDSYLGTRYDISHFEALWDLGYLPVEVRALEEGSIIEAKIPILTIHNTLPEFYWLTNFLETLISTTLWKPMHSASMSYAYKKILERYANETCKDSKAGLKFQQHDFSMRGMQSLESAIASALGFLVCSEGTDTLPVLQAAEYYYSEPSVAFSVPASEHAVMTAYGKENEIDSFSRILKLFPEGYVSMVSDQFDLWNVLTTFLPRLKEDIMARNGKAIFRPDSGDPADILCGLKYKNIKAENYEEFLETVEEELHEILSENTPHGEYGGNIDGFYKWNNKFFKANYNPDWNRHDKQYYFIDNYGGNKTTAEEIDLKPSEKGVIELLWEVFGGTINEQGYQMLDSHIGAIYGDSITLDRAEEICERLKEKGFASINVVFGIGSYSMGYATRDNQGSAVKATYVEVNGEGREIFKDPITDDGTKKSARGLITVVDGKLKDQATWDEVNSNTNELKLLFSDGVFLRETTFAEIRERING